MLTFWTVILMTYIGPKLVVTTGTILYTIFNLVWNSGYNAGKKQYKELKPIGMVRIIWGNTSGRWRLSNFLFRKKFRFNWIRILF